jgi:gamma-glutamyltranspeptidase
MSGAADYVGKRGQRSGAVVAANRLAAEVGAQVLRTGGNAADAAVATAAALSVVDPANCGIGGYGGFAVVHRVDETPHQVGFNAAVSQAQRSELLHARRGPGQKVTPPSVVAGLCALGSRFGRLPRAVVWAPAIALARDGFQVGPGLAEALRWAHSNHRGLNDAFRDTYFSRGTPLPEGAPLRQPALAETLECIATEGADALRSGRLVDAIVESTRQGGGQLSVEDFDSLDASVEMAAVGSYEGADVWTSDPEQCGASILLAALSDLDGADLGVSRQARYIDAIGGALSRAWQRRNRAFQPLSSATSQTSHLCACDSDGMLVSMTFTHGPVWFGSGLLTRNSGMLLNCGAYLLARRMSDGAIVAQPHLTPSIVRHGEVRYALGSPGGRRIPAIVLQAVVDLVHYQVPVDHVLGAPRVSATAEGVLEGERALVEAVPDRAMTCIETREYFGPAGALAWSLEGVRGTADPRFDDACVVMA